MGSEPFRVPAKHWFMRRRCARMTTWEYIRWKQQQVIQSELNQINAEPFIPGKESIVTYTFPRVINLNLSPEFMEKMNEANKMFIDQIRNAKPNSTENHERSVAENQQ